MSQSAQRESGGSETNKKIFLGYEQERKNWRRTIATRRGGNFFDQLTALPTVC
jgi:hypothetical protein